MMSFSLNTSLSLRSLSTLFANQDIAVIFRNNSTADGIEATLREQGIVCRRKGGISFFDAAEVKAMLDLVGVVVNPKDSDGIYSAL